MLNRNRRLVIGYGKLPFTLPLIPKCTPTHSLGLYFSFPCFDLPSPLFFLLFVKLLFYPSPFPHATTPSVSPKHILTFSSTSIAFLVLHYLFYVNFRTSITYIFWQHSVCYFFHVWPIWRKLLSIMSIYTNRN